ncbi:MAG: 3-dehydroquinate synthase [bacterium]|nr:3-dehydroquinate synthase [bacterium]MDT8365468.1 3-dehydroquinate synthase [bacterium]
MALGVVHVELSERSYSIYIGDEAWELLEENLRGWNPAGKAMVVTDERVNSIYGHRIEKLAGALESTATVVVPEGEKSKSFGHLEDLCRKMAGAGLDRGSLVVALGGGVVGDLAGLAASLYLRGVSVIQVPTTLLSMVDSSTGGKTGINLPEGKNQVGTFHQPQAVYANTDVLRTLESRDWYSGMAEIVKISLTLDPELFAYLEKLNDLGPEGGVDIPFIVETACRRKAEVISIDEKEAGPRLVLNFGHTLAHALESSLGLGEIRHGEAVAIGMRGALSLSKQMCGLDEGQYRRAMAVIEKIPVPDNRYDQNLERFLTRDKKRIGGRVRCILLEDIGRCHVTSLDDPGDLVKALASP